MKRFSLLLGFIFSGVFLFLLFFKIDWQEFFRAFGSANYYYILSVIFIVFAGCYLRALRWRWIIMPIKEVAPYDLFVATVIGYTANTVLPARLGEFVRAHIIGRRERVSRASAFATIIVERLFDGLSILILLILTLYVVRIPVKKALIAAGFSALFLYLAIIFIILMFNFKKQFVLNFFRRFLGFLGETGSTKFVQSLESMADGFKIIERGRHMGIIALYSFLIWVVTALGIYLTVYSFGLHISLSAACFVLALITFAVLIPSSPGFVGTFHAGMAYGLMVFGISKEGALSIAIVYHGLSFLPVVLLGFYYLWKYNLSFSRD